MKNLIKNNQSGFVYIALAVSLSGVVLSSLALTYVYSMNRARYQARIKEAYKLVNVTETAAKTVKAAWDKASIAAPGANDATLSASVNTNLAAGTAAAGCFATCQAQNAGQTILMCFDNTDNANAPYCFTGGTQVAYHMLEPKTGLGKFEKFLAKLDTFFDGVNYQPIESISLAKPTMLGWVLKEKVARANGDCAPGYTGVYPDCVAISPGGGYAGGGNDGGQVVCPTTVECNTASMNNPDIDPSCKQLRCSNMYKRATANAAVDCSSNPNLAGCAKCVSGGSSCGVVSAKMPGTNQTVTQTFRISKAGDSF